MSDAGNQAPSPPPANWTESLPDEEWRIYARNRGLHEKSPAEAALMAMKAHRDAVAEVTRLHNTQNAVHLPSSPDDKAGWEGVWKRLGKPESADAYKIEGLKFADGQEPDAAFLANVRQIAFDLNLPTDAAARLAERVMQMADADEHAERERGITRNSAAEAELRRAWGPQHDYFNFQVGRAMDLLGMDTGIMEMARAAGPEAYVKFMQGMRGLASKMGEASMLRSEGGAGRTSSNYTPETAQARIQELRNTPSWAAAFARGDVEAVRELSDLTRVIVAARNPGNTPSNVR